MKAGIVWAFDLGKGSIGEAVRQGNQFLHKAPSVLRAMFVENKKGAAKAPVQELRLIASLLSSRQFKILATAGFDLDTIRINPSLSVNHGLYT